MVVIRNLVCSSMIVFVRVLVFAVWINWMNVIVIGCGVFRCGIVAGMWNAVGWMEGGEINVGNSKLLQGFEVRLLVLEKAEMERGDAAE